MPIHEQGHGGHIDADSQVHIWCYCAVGLAIEHWVPAAGVTGLWMCAKFKLRGSVPSAMRRDISRRYLTGCNSQEIPLDSGSLSCMATGDRALP